MKVIDSLQLNKFAPVSVPRAKDLFERVGGRIPPTGTKGFVAELSKSKMELLADSEQALLDEMESLEDTRK